MTLRDALGENTDELPTSARDAIAAVNIDHPTIEDLFVLVRTARDGRAIKLADRLLQMIAAQTDAKQDLRYRLELAQNLVAAGKIDQAHQSLSETQNRFPESAHAFKLEADLFASQLEYQQALSLLRLCPLKDQNPAVNEDTIFRAIRLMIYLAASENCVDFRPPVSAANVEQALIVMMIRDEADVIGHNLSHHYALGFRKFVLILNCCIDGTKDEIQAFKTAHADAIVCSIEDPVEGYYQSSKTQAATEFAQSYFDGIQRPVRWCFVLDADEFINLGSGHGLSTLIESAQSARKEFIAFNLCNGCPSSGLEFTNNGNPYSHFDTIVARAVPVVPKVAFKIALRPRIAMGNHSLNYPGISIEHCFIAAQAGACLVHLPYRSISQVRTKIVNGGSAYEATKLHASLGAHWRRLYKDYLEHGESVFARQLSTYNATTLRAASATPKFSFS